MEEKVLETASLAGHILLENGAEIARVEETMERIARHYGVEARHFVLSNGIFTTGRTGHAKVEFIPFKGAQLERVAAVNQVSRDIEAGHYTVGQAYAKLLDIRSSKPKPAWEQVLGSAVGSAGFCIIFGGGLLDAAAAFTVGLLLWLFVVGVSSRWMSKPIGNIVGSALATLLCIVFHRIGFGVSLGNMIVGSLIPLIPGVAFTNGIRDIADEDYIAGATRLLDAIMVFFCIAAGVVLTFMAFYLFEGSIIEVSGTEPDALCGHLLIQTSAAFAGTVGFAVIFGVPRRNYLQTAVVAAIGWAAYLALVRGTVLGPAISTFAATVIVASLARSSASWFKTPSTVYLIPGVFPMIPGGGIFWTTLFLVQSRLGLALHSGMLSLEVTAAIVLGIVLVSSLPKKLFYRKK